MIPTETHNVESARMKKKCDILLLHFMLLCSLYGVATFITDRLINIYTYTRLRMYIGKDMILLISYS